MVHVVSQLCLGLQASFPGAGAPPPPRDVFIFHFRPFGHGPALGEYGTSYERRLTLISSWRLLYKFKTKIVWIRIFYCTNMELYLQRKKTEAQVSRNHIFTTACAFGFFYFWEQVFSWLKCPESSVSSLTNVYRYFWSQTEHNNCSL